MKRRFAALGVGVLVLAIVFGFAALISSDVRRIYALGAVLLFATAVWLGRKNRRDWFAFACLVGPLAGVFGWMVVPKLPAIWPHLLFWVIAAGIGWILAGANRSIRTILFSGLGVFIALSIWYCAFYLPGQIAKSLSRFQNSSAPTFAFRPVTEGAVPLTSGKGKILVIDFFATNCGPCLAELPKLAAVREDLKNRSDIEFVVVASDASGDTPERFKSVIERRHVTLPLAFDEAGKAHSAFGFTGVPALVVLDRTGQIRLKHEGYNAAESNFQRDLVQFLETL